MVSKYPQRLFGFVTKHVCDRRMDGQTDEIKTPKTTVAYRHHAVKKLIKTDNDAIVSVVVTKVSE